MTWKQVASGVMRELVLKHGVRADGRSVTDVRPIRSRAGVLPRTHGSALFTRGETQVGRRHCAHIAGERTGVAFHSARWPVWRQWCERLRQAGSHAPAKPPAFAGLIRAIHCPTKHVLPRLPQALCVATIGTAADAQRVDNMRSGFTSTDEDDAPRPRNGDAQRFYLQYFFPPSSVGETGRVGGVGALGRGGGGTRCPGRRRGVGLGCGGVSSCTWPRCSGRLWLGSPWGCCGSRGASHRGSRVHTMLGTRTSQSCAHRLARPVVQAGVSWGVGPQP